MLRLARCAEQWLLLRAESLEVLRCAAPSLLLRCAEPLLQLRCAEPLLLLLLPRCAGHWLLLLRRAALPLLLQQQHHVALLLLPPPWPVLVLPSPAVWLLPSVRPAGAWQASSGTQPGAAIQK
jgi:hypothetical protein